MVADELLATADAVNIHGVVVGLLVGAREALGAPGEREDGGVALGLDGDLPGLVQTHLGVGRSGHEHDDHEKDDDHGDGTEGVTVGGVELHFIVCQYFFIKCVKEKRIVSS